MREIQPSDLIGKTIKSIDHTCVNVLSLTFSDDSVLELWAEDAINTQFGSIPGIFVGDSLKDNSND
jgi:hypothetical protein